MFIKLKLFKSLLKNAYKSFGLTVGMSTNGILCLRGQYWTINLDYNFIPKEYKAAIIELTGDIPTYGETWDCKAGQGNQYCIEDLTDVYYRINIERFKVPYGRTDFIYNPALSEYRIMRAITGGSDGRHNIVGMYETVLCGIDPDLIDTEGGETNIIGPLGNSQYDLPGLLWYNNVMSFMVESMKPRAEEKPDEAYAFKLLGQPELKLTEQEKQGDASPEESQMTLEELESAEEDDE